MFKKNFIVLFILITTGLQAQNIYEFLRLDYSPRAAALSGSFVSADKDINVIFYNPAGAATLEGTPVSFSFVKHLMDINSASIAGSKYYEGLGRFTAAVQYINYGSFTEATERGEKLGEFGAGDLAALIGYTNYLDSNFYYGVNAKFIYSSIAEQSSTGYAFDMGLHYEIPDSRWHFGFSILNLGSQITSYLNKSEDLPLDMRIGFSKELEKLPFRLFWSFNKLNEKEDNFFSRFKNISAGGEFRLGQSFKLRLGYDNAKRKDLKIGTTTGLAGFSLGFGFKVSSYTVDYAFSSLGLVGAIHRFGISTSL